MTKRDVYAIWQLVSLTREDFEKIYVATLEAFKSLIADDELYHRGHTMAVRSLMVRRAYMLPVGTDAETCYREQEVWTYAVFVCALFLEAWAKLNAEDQSNFETIMSVIPAHCRAWLERHDEVISQMQFNPSKVDSRVNTIAEIISVAKPVPSTHAKENMVEDVSVDDVEQAIDEHKTLSKTLIDWLEDRTEAKELSVNEKGSFVFRVEQGVFLKMPGVFNAFIKSRAAHNFVQAHGALTKAKFIKQLGIEGGCVQSQGGGMIHEYFVGQWQERNFIKGLVALLPEGSKLVAVPVTDLIKPEIKS